MYLCNCRPSNHGLTTTDVIDTIRDGASRVRDVCAKTDAGNACKTCRPTLAKLNTTIKELAVERDATGAAWPTRDQFDRATTALNTAACS